MDPKRWFKISAALEEARELDPGQRQEFLEQLRVESTSVHGEVVSLLAAESEEMDFLEKPPLEDLLGIGDHLGPYKIVREIEGGGMGMVFIGRQEEPVQREVAIKVIGVSALAGSGRRRFEVERRLLAKMNHSYIAKLFDTGILRNGLPYFVMEYISGEPMVYFCNNHELNLDQRLELFEKICHAVSHAHLKGIIHRDLKPSNILVTKEGNEYIPKLIDFGIAKHLEHNENLTQTGLSPGTLRYMSPEQCGALDSNGNPLDQDVRTDVYALGVILYELLVGEPPFSWGKVTNIARAYRDICEKEAEIPSRKYRESGIEKRKFLAAGMGMGTRELERRLQGDLDWICKRALEKRPDRRYNSVEHFREDIERFRKNLPIEAGPPSVIYRGRKFIRRNWPWLAVTTLIIGLIIAAAIVLGAQNKTIREERDRARIEAEKVGETLAFMEEIFSYADPYKPDAVKDATVHSVLKAAGEELQERPLENPEAFSLLAHKLAEIQYNLSSFQEAAILQERALAVTMEALPNEHKLIALRADLLGRIYMRLGRFDEAEHHLQLALQQHLKAPNSTFQSVARAQNNLAGVFLESGRFAVAEEHLDKGIELLQQVQFPKTNETAELLNNKGLVLHFQGKQNEAEPFYRRALDIFAAVNGDDYPLVGTLHQNLAGLNYEQGSFETALQDAKSALTTYEKNFHDDHQKVRSAKSVVALILIELGHPEQALEITASILAATKDGLIDRAHLAHAMALRKLGRYEEAVTMFQTYDRFFQQHGGSPIWHQVCLNQLAYCRAVLDSNQENERPLIVSYQNLLQATGEGSLYSRNARSLVHDYYQKSDQPELAAAYAEKP